MALGQLHIRPRLMKIIDWFLSKQSWTELDRLLGQLKEDRDIFFVEIGSNDGKLADPLYCHIIENKWSGIMVEPVKSNYDRLKANYANVPNVVFENVAISTRTEKRPFYRIRDDLPFLPKWTRGIGSFYLDIVLKHEKLITNLRDYIVTESVECITFDTLLQRNNVAHIDVLLIDAEGYDLELIKSINFDITRPYILVYEHKHLSLSDNVDCAKILIEKGYCLTKHHSNTLAYQGSINRTY